MNHTLHSRPCNLTSRGSITTSSVEALTKLLPSPTIRDFARLLAVGWPILAWCVNLLTVSAGTLVQIGTPLGSLVVETFDQEKPVTVANFLRYVDSQAYARAFFHRLVPGFVVQGGGFYLSNSASGIRALAVTNYGTITNEYNVGPKLSNTLGTLAMAKLGGDPHSATSQWFINLGNNAANLDNQNGGFTVFARVVAGTNMFGTFNSFSSRGTSNLVVNAGVFAELPVLKLVDSQIHADDFVFTDLQRVMAPSLSVEPGPQGTITLSWSSLSNLLHRVEWAESWPPSWNVLKEMKGSGALMSLEVPIATAPQGRFFRVLLPP